MSHYMQLYSGNQHGNGISDIQIYRSPIHRQQHGGGLGNYFAHAFRYLKLLLSSGLNVLRDQGVKSTGAVLSQLSSKDIKSILKEESVNALKNLSDKAINKLQQSKGLTKSLSTQTGTGTMPIGLSPLQMQRLQRGNVALKSTDMMTTEVPSHKSRRKQKRRRRSGISKKSIKVNRTRKPRHSKRNRKIGTSISTKTKRQIGGRGKRKRTSTSTTTTKKSRKRSTPRTLDFFD